MGDASVVVAPTWPTWSCGSTPVWQAPRGATGWLQLWTFWPFITLGGLLAGGIGAGALHERLPPFVVAAGVIASSLAMGAAARVSTRLCTPMSTQPDERTAPVPALVTGTALGGAFDGLQWVLRADLPVARQVWIEEGPRRCCYELASTRLGASSAGSWDLTYLYRPAAAPPPQG